LLFLIVEMNNYEDEDEGEYDVNEGPLPAVVYENNQQDYEQEMENGKMLIFVLVYN